MYYNPHGNCVIVPNESPKQPQAVFFMAQMELSYTATFNPQRQWHESWNPGFVQVPGSEKFMAYEIFPRQIYNWAGFHPHKLPNENRGELTDHTHDLWVVRNQDPRITAFWIIPMYTTGVCISSPVIHAAGIARVWAKSRNHMIFATLPTLPLIENVHKIYTE